MSTEENKEVERRIIGEIFNKRNPALVDELLDTNYVYHGTGGMGSQGREEFKQAITMLFTAFPDFHGTIEDMIAEGDRVVSRSTFGGTHKGDFQGIAPTGKQVKFTAITLSRFEGGKNMETWDFIDNLGMMQQLGVIPKK